MRSVEVVEALPLPQAVSEEAGIVDDDALQELVELVGVDPVRSLDPDIVLIRVSETDGAVAGEPNAMAALRYAADSKVGWSWARNARGRRPRGCPSHPERVGPRLGRRGAMARSLDLRVRSGNGVPPLGCSATVT
jgi:hypothetical protein